MNLKIGKRYTHRHSTPFALTRAGWTYKDDLRDVLLMAISGKYTMVRRRHAMPYVCPVNELEPTSPPSIDAATKQEGETT